MGVWVDQAPANSAEPSLQSDKSIQGMKPQLATQELAMSKDIPGSGRENYGELGKYHGLNPTRGNNGGSHVRPVTYKFSQSSEM